MQASDVGVADLIGHASLVSPRRPSTRFEASGRCVPEPVRGIERSEDAEE